MQRYSQSIYGYYQYQDKPASLIQILFFMFEGAKILNFTLHHIISAFTFQLTDMPDSTENLKLDIKAEYEGVHEILLC